MAVFLSALACLGILLSPLFINLCLDHRYRSAAPLVPLVVMGYLFHGLFSLFDLSILHAKRTTSVFAISLLAFAVNLALNFAMIPRWGMYGAAWATTIAYASKPSAHLSWHSASSRSPTACSRSSLASPSPVERSG